MSTVVQFIGGELDGQVKQMKRLAPIYCCPWRPRAPQGFNVPALPKTTPRLPVTTYFLIFKGDLPFYVERELVLLSEREGIDPCDA